MDDSPWKLVLRKLHRLPDLLDCSRVSRKWLALVDTMAFHHWRLSNVRLIVDYKHLRLAEDNWRIMCPYCSFSYSGGSRSPNID